MFYCNSLSRNDDIAPVRRSGKNSIYHERSCFHFVARSGGNRSLEIRRKQTDGLEGFILRRFVGHTCLYHCSSVRITSTQNQYKAVIRKEQKGKVSDGSLLNGKTF